MYISFLYFVTTAMKESVKGQVMSADVLTDGKEERKVIVDETIVPIVLVSFVTELLRNLLILQQQANINTTGS